MRIGYSPFTNDFSAPGDRRRFVHYARARGIEIEIADPSKEYDLVVLSLATDFTKWVDYKYPDCKIVVDLIDGYLEETSSLKPRLRGLAKFVVRQHSKLWLSYKALLEAMCRRSYAVVCTTEEQRRTILRYCPNVHVILDYHGAAATNVKTNYGIGDRLNVVWEGLPGNLTSFRSIVPSLMKLRATHDVAVHLVTDIEYPLALRHVGYRPTKQLIEATFPKELPVYLYEWNQRMFSTICCACDIALIPANYHDPMFMRKPENKLLLFWRMGLPVIAAATPAFNRAMDAAGLDFTCTSEQEWDLSLARMIDDVEVRRSAGQAGYRTANTCYGEEVMLRRWDAIVREAGAACEPAPDLSSVPTSG